MMTNIPYIDIEMFSYELPAGRIAQFPAEGRDLSKLLVYKNERICEAIFKDLPGYLPEHAHMVVNQTRVVHARLLFRKETGAAIELFCLEPVSPMRELQQAFECQSHVIWKCLVGNSKRWRSGKLSLDFSVNGVPGALYAERIDKRNDHSLIQFSWEPASLTFSDILNNVGMIPLPPYLGRDAVNEDKTRYQTIFAENEGSVAAPTAGLHFTQNVLKQLEAKGITRSLLTLHVGAGTFKPIQSADILNHEMHVEKVIISRSTIEAILDKGSASLVAVGTTTLRTLESLHWHGVKLLVDQPADPHLNVLQWDPYTPVYAGNITPEDSLEAVLKAMSRNGLKELAGQTQLMIVPGYKFQITDILITNFHLPRSTLLLLVAAFAGDGWKDVYQYALDHEFRFLSYGDSCLFFRK
jgi:S-adenosylmethionine:tRNA ribosyltransferase-isomerase